LKVDAADEFDAVFPVRFVLFDTEVIESPRNELPPGIAEIKVTRLKKDIKPSSLIKNREGFMYINTEVFHDTVFKGLLDKIIYNFQQECEDLRAGGRPISFKITRKSHAPALILDVTVYEKDDCGNRIGTQSMSVDVVPGFLTDANDSKKCLVSRWVPQLQNIGFRAVYPDSQTTWRISLSHFEMQVFEDFQNQNDVMALRLIAACRILKSVKGSSWSGHYSQFNSIMKSYHLKNILLYSLLYITVARKTVSSISEALGYLVAMTKMALSEGNLPQCFTDKFALAKFYPNERYHQAEAMDNLLAEKSEDSLRQANLDLERVLIKLGLGGILSGEYEELLSFFSDRMNGVIPYEGWRCAIQ